MSREALSFSICQYSAACRILDKRGLLLLVLLMATFPSCGTEDDAGDVASSENNQNVDLHPSSSAYSGMGNAVWDPQRGAYGGLYKHAIRTANHIITYAQEHNRWSKKSGKDKVREFWHDG